MNQTCFWGQFQAHLNVKGSDDVVREHLLVGESDREWPKALALRFWPILLTLDLFSLHEVGDHDNGLGFLLPHKPPEIHQSFLHGTCHHGFMDIQQP